MNGIYVHVPFCVRKCAYCDFYSIVAGEEARERYCGLLLEELDLLLRSFPGQAKVPADTVYFGGGTPSVLGPERLRRLLEGIRSRLPVAEGAEVTLEANPGTIREEDFSRLRESGFNRVSLGVQSFRPATLAALGRIHSVGGRPERFPGRQGSPVSRPWESISSSAIPGQDGRGLGRRPPACRRPSAGPPLGIRPLAGARDADPCRDRTRGDLPPFRRRGGPHVRHGAGNPRPPPGTAITRYPISRCRGTNAGTTGNTGGGRDISGWDLPPTDCCSRGNPRRFGMRTANPASLPEYASRIGEGRLPWAETGARSGEDAWKEFLIFGLRLAEGVSSRKGRNDTAPGRRTCRGPSIAWSNRVALSGTGTASGCRNGTGSFRTRCFSGSSEAPGYRLS